MISIIPVPGLPEIEPDHDLAALFVETLGEDFLRDGDVLVVTQKVVSKAEGRTADAETKKEVVASESRRMLRQVGTMVISETHHGFVCANAGVDESNISVGQIALLPVDPDASARRIRSRLEHLTGCDVKVIISDTFGRAWRLGQTDIAIGVAGMQPFTDYVGTQDTQGREMRATRICTADELAGAAEMVMGKADGVCAAVVRGAPVTSGRGAAVQIVRPPGDDLFR